jgi:hypothetical protein
MAQLYVGKRLISKRRRRAIRRFVVLAFDASVQLPQVAKHSGVTSIARVSSYISDEAPGLALCKPSAPAPFNSEKRNSSQ